MSQSIQFYVDFVNEQIDYQVQRSEHYDKQNDAVRADAYRKRSEQFRQLAEFIEQNYPQTLSPLKPSVYISPDDIKNLPQELLDQLNISDSDRSDFQIIEAINSVGGIASIDKILIAYYHITKQIYDRQKLMAKLYRMSVKKMLFSHPHKKGIYSTSEINENETKGVENDDD
jgi:hypothetical protein